MRRALLRCSLLESWNDVGVTYSDLVATIALVISLGTAVWTTVRTVKWDRPVLEVTGAQWM